MGDANGHVLEVVLARAAHVYGLRSGGLRRARLVATPDPCSQDAPPVIGQRLPGVTDACRSELPRRTRGDNPSAVLTRLRSHLDQPVGAGDDVEVVLDHQQRMPAIQQLVEGAHQLRDVLEVQAGSGLVEYQQARARVAESIRKVTGQLEALRLATRERGHGLTQSHIAQPHVSQGLQPVEQRRLAGKEHDGLGHGHLKDFVVCWPCGQTAFDAHFQDLVAIALAVAGAALAGTHPPAAASPRARSRCRRRWSSGRVPELKLKVPGV